MAARGGEEAERRCEAERRAATDSSDANGWRAVARRQAVPQSAFAADAGVRQPPPHVATRARPKSTVPNTDRVARVERLPRAAWGDARQDALAAVAILRWRRARRRRVGGARSVDSVAQERGTCACARRLGACRRRRRRRGADRRPAAAAGFTRRASGRKAGFKNDGAGAARRRARWRRCRCGGTLSDDAGYRRSDVARRRRSTCCAPASPRRRTRACARRARPPPRRRRSEARVRAMREYIDLKRNKDTPAASAAWWRMRLRRDRVVADVLDQVAPLVADLADGKVRRAAGLLWRSTRVTFVSDAGDEEGEDEGGLTTEMLRLFWGRMLAPEDETNTELRLFERARRARRADAARRRAAGGAARRRHDARQDGPRGGAPRRRPGEGLLRAPRRRLHALQQRLRRQQRPRRARRLGGVGGGGARAPPRLRPDRGGGVRAAPPRRRAAARRVAHDGRLSRLGGGASTRAARARRAARRASR